MIHLIIYLYFIPPTPELVYQECVDQGILCPDIVTRQACLETGYFRSYNSTERNNLFGMRHKSKIKEGNKMGYYKYDNWRESVKDYKRFISRRHRIGETYYEFLNRIGYAEAEDYEYKLKLIRWNN